MNRLGIVLLAIQAAIVHSANDPPIRLNDVVAQITRSVPADTTIAEVIVVRGTIVGHDLVTKMWTERSGRDSQRSFAEVVVRLEPQGVLNGPLAEPNELVVVDPRPVYYHAVTGEAVRLVMSHRPQPVYPELYAPVGTDVLLVAFRCRDGRTRGAWRPYMGESFAIAIGLTRTAGGPYRAVVGPSTLDAQFGRGRPGTLVPDEALAPHTRPIAASPEAIEAAVSGAVRDLLR